MKGLLGAALLVAIALAVSACATAQRASEPTRHSTTSPDSGHSHGSVVSARTVSSTGLILDARVRCTASVSRSVQAGGPLGLTVALRHVPHPPVKGSLPRGNPWLVVRGGGGPNY